MKLTYLLIILGLLSFTVDSQIVSLATSIHYPTLDTFFLFITQVETIFIVILGFTLYLHFFKKQKILPIWCACGMTAALIYAIKLLVIRPRPYAALGFVPLVTATASSFPSNHTGVVFAVLPFVEKKYYWLVFALLVAFSRLYVGVHYPSDIIFGGLIGYGVGWMIRERLLRWFPYSK